MNGLVSIIKILFNDGTHFVRVIGHPGASIVDSCK